MLFLITSSALGKLQNKIFMVVSRRGLFKLFTVIAVDIIAKIKLKNVFADMSIASNLIFPIEFPFFLKEKDLLSANGIEEHIIHLPFIAHD